MKRAPDGKPRLLNEARNKIRRRVYMLTEAPEGDAGPRPGTVLLAREFRPIQIVKSGIVVA